MANARTSKSVKSNAKSVGKKADSSAAKNTAKNKSKPVSKAAPKTKAAAKPGAKKPAAQTKRLAKPTAKVAKATGTRGSKPAVQSSAKSLSKSATPGKSGTAGKLLAAAATVAGALGVAALAARKSAKPVSLAKVFMPLDDRILIEKAEAATRTAGGLYIPDTVASEDRSSQGLVVAVGRGRRNKKGQLRPLDVQLGDTVMFGAGGGSEVMIDQQSFVCLREEEIIAIMKP